MFIEQEKLLIEKNYEYNQKSDSILSFFYKDDHMSQINVSIVDDSYKVSFPMLNHSIHYATYFKEKEKVKKYLNFLINSHL
jgi:hypothetical protein